MIFDYHRLWSRGARGGALFCIVCIGKVRTLTQQCITLVTKQQTASRSPNTRAGKAILKKLSVGGNIPLLARNPRPHARFTCIMPPPHFQSCSKAYVYWLLA